MISLVGYTGFVGSNIYDSGMIDNAYNSKNITSAYGTSPDLLIYSGMRAEKYLANTNPDKDMELVVDAQKNIAKIAPKKLVLISTIDVFKHPNDVDEESPIDTQGLHPYGYNRYLLEEWVKSNYPDSLIIRLPGLFGKNLKKNFIYDYMNIIPFMLKENKFTDLLWECPQLPQYYELTPNGFYKVKELSAEKRAELKDIFSRLSFNALNFTDSRNVYQFYNLKRLWFDIQKALEANLKLWHPATEPVSISELYEYLTGDIFINELQAPVVRYDYRTKYASLFGGENGYICKKQDVLSDVKKLVEENGR